MGRRLKLRPLLDTKLMIAKPYKNRHKRTYVTSSFTMTVKELRLQPNLKFNKASLTARNVGSELLYVQSTESKN